MRRLLLRVADQVGMLGFLTFLVSALCMVGLWILLLFDRLGWPGLALGVLTAPLASLFPFLHAWIEGALYWPYVALWGAGVLGVAVSMGRGLLPPGE